MRSRVLQIYSWGRTVFLSFPRLEEKYNNQLCRERPPVIIILRCFNLSRPVSPIPIEYSLKLERIERIELFSAQLGRLATFLMLTRNVQRFGLFYMVIPTYTMIYGMLQNVFHLHSILIRIGGRMRTRHTARRSPAAMA